MIGQFLLNVALVGTLLNGVIALSMFLYMVLHKKKLGPVPTFLWINNGVGVVLGLVGFLLALNGI